MTDETTMTVAERLRSLWDHLGLAAAVVATQVPGDIAAFAASCPERIAGLALCVPVRLDPAPFAAVADRLLLIAGSRGMTADVTSRAAQRLAGARRVVLDDYDAVGWADVTRDRGAEMTEGLRSFLDSSMIALAPPPARSGSHAGITFSIEGAGPPLVLLPFFLAPSQWSPIVPALARDFSVIILGGRHLGGVVALEDRARSRSYRAMVRELFDVIAPRPGETILDVGCGSGALDRLVAHWLGEANPITATDVNPFLLREAAVLAAEDGVSGSITFRSANAEALPFPDASFDCAFTVTVLEECDADRAMRELRRVVRPGGRVGVIVRSIDLPQWWHLALPDRLRATAEVAPQSVATYGVADGSLYRRMRAAGFADLVCFPHLVTFDQPDGPIWRYREDHVLSQLSVEETAVWRQATAAVRAEGLLFMANPLHCAVGTVPVD
jgi:ubiquinone/menaquinone biosynthesis C-methylase UbiE